MLLLSIHNLSHSYGERVLFSDVHFNIETGDKIGVIGINGTGKSTLLRHVAMLDGGRDGEIRTNGKCVIEYLPQNPPYQPEETVLEHIFSGNSPLMVLLRRYEAALQEVTEKPDSAAAQHRLMAVQQEMDADFAWQLESEAKAVLTRLGITDFTQPMAALSGGQRKRVALAGVLVRPSDLLILDEPTNHMDNDTVAWLEGVLEKRKGALLMVTHDRYFFDRVINRTLELDGGKAYLYVANYSGFLQKREERRELEAGAARKLQNIYRRELAWISRGAEARRTKKKDRVERFAEIEKQALAKTKTQELEMQSVASRLGRTVVELEHVSVLWEGCCYVRDFSYVLLRRDRVGIVGPNGCGKSSLMDVIAGRLQPSTGSVLRGQTVKIGYFTQHTEFPNPEERVLQYIRDAGEFVRGADGTYISAAQMLERFLFPEQQQWTPVGKLSGGEQRRLQLLRVLMEAPNVLLLDEPTNDLDIPTLSVLEDYLDNFAGAVIAVSHDRYFLDRFATRIFAYMGEGRLQQFVGGWSEYAAERQRLNELAKEQAAGDAGSAASRGNATPSSHPAKAEVMDGGASTSGTSDEACGASATPVRKMTYKERLEYAHIEADIAEQEGRVEMFSALMEREASDFTKLAELTREQQAAQQKLDELMERWAYLAELAEAQED